MSPDNSPMGSTLELLDVEENAPIEFETQNALSTALTEDMVRLYAYKATEVKGEIDVLGAEISQRHEKMRVINDLITSINSVTDDQNCLNITDNEDIQEKVGIALNLGVKIPAGQFKFNALQRDRLIENLHLTADSWDKENKSQTQKIEIYMKELDRYMMVLKEICKDEKQIKQGMVRGIAGG